MRKFSKAIRSIQRNFYLTFYIREFSVISNNCWGGEIYKELKKPFNTPFIGLYLYGDDYLKILRDLDFYISQPLQFIRQSKYFTQQPSYPIGLLDGDIEIHFMHYKDENEAKEKWERRAKRLLSVNEKNRFYKIDDRDGSSIRTISEFHKLPFLNKISFGVMKLDIPNHIQIKEVSEDGSVPDGVKLYQISSSKYFNVFRWLSHKK